MLSLHVGREFTKNPSNVLPALDALAVEQSFQAFMASPPERGAGHCEQH